MKAVLETIVKPTVNRINQRIYLVWKRVYVAASNSNSRAISVLLVFVFLVTLMPVSFSENQNIFNNSLTAENFSGLGQWTNTTYIRLPKTATIESAVMTVKAYNDTTGSENFPSNVSIDVGNDGTTEFNNSRVETTLMLQTPDTENLDDTDGYVGSVSDGSTSASISAGEQIAPVTQQLYIKFGPGTTFGSIIKGDLWLRAYSGSGASRYNSGNLFSLYEVANDTWEESTCRGHVTLFPCPTHQDLITAPDVTDFLSGGNPDDWVNWTVTDWLIENFITNNRQNVSFMLNFTYAPGADSRIDFRSKEYSTDTTHRPFLNITAAVNLTYESSNVLNITSQINSYLSSCSPVNGFCDVPIVVAGSDGIIELSNLNITYNDQPKIEFTTDTLANDSRSSNNYIFVEVNVQDVNITNVTLYLYNSSLDLIRNHTNISNIGYSTNYSVNWTSLEDGNYSYNATVIDSGNSINSTETRFLILDSTIPQISFAGGIENNNTFFNRDWIFVNVSVTEASFSNITYYLYDSNFNLVNETNFTTQTFELNFTNIVDTDELYYYNVTVRDFVGNENSTGTRVITLDSVFPGIRLDSPLNDSWQTSPVTLLYTPTDSNLDSCILYHNETLWKANETNQTVASGVQDTITLNLADGHFRWSVLCNDSAGNQLFNESNFTINVDSTIPTISFGANTEVNNSYFNRNWIFVNISANDTNEANLTFYLYNSSFDLVNETNVSAGTRSLNFTNLPDTNERYYYNVTIRDRALNENSTSIRELVLDSTNPQLQFAGGTELNNSYASKNWIYVNLTVTETNFANVTFYLYNSSLDLVNETTTTSTNINFTNFQDSNELYYFNSTVKDLALNTNDSQTRQITLDTNNPSVIFSGGTEANNTFFTRSWIFVNVSIADANIRNATVYLYNSSFDIINETNFTAINQAGSNLSINFTGLNENDAYFFNVTVRDSASNANSSITRIQTLDSLTPQINFDTGTLENYTFVSADRIFVNVSVVETNIANLTFYLYDSNSLLVNETNTTNHFANFSNLADTNEQFTLNVTVRDRVSLFNSTISRIITLDTTPPSLAFAGGTENNYTFADRNWIFINVSASDTNIGNLTFNLFTASLSLANQTNYTAFNNSNSSINITNLADRDEAYRYNVTLTDLAGNSNSTETRILTLDGLTPSINLTYPVNGTTYDFFQTILNYTVSDANLDSCWYTLDNGASNTSITCGQNVTGLSSGQGIFNWTVYVNDSAGHINGSGIEFTVVLEAPNVTLQYPVNDTIFTNGTNIYLNYTASDNNTIAKCTVYHDFNGSFVANDSDSAVTSGIQDSFVFNHSNDGLKIWNVLCNDTTGTTSFALANFTFKFDTSVPIIDDINVTTTSNSNTVSFVASYDELTCNNTFFSVYRSNGSIENNLTNISTSCDNFNDTFAVTEYGTYNITVYVQDKIGFENSLSTQFTTAAASSGGSGSSGGGGGGGGGGGSGGGGGGGAAPSGPRYSKSQFYQLIEEGSQTTFKLNLDTVAIKKIIFTPVKNLEGVSISASNVLAKPDALIQPEGIVYQWFDVDIDKFTSKDLSNIVFEFSVETSWIHSNRIDVDSIHLVRFLAPDDMQDLPTQYLNKNGSHRFYSATSPGLSYFAIVGIQLPQEENETLDSGYIVEDAAIEQEPTIEQPTEIKEEAPSKNNVFAPIASFFGKINFRIHWRFFGSIIFVGLLLASTISGSGYAYHRVVSNKSILSHLKINIPKPKEIHLLNKKKKYEENTRKKQEPSKKVQHFKKPSKFILSLKSLFHRKNQNFENNLVASKVYLVSKKGSISAYSLFTKLTQKRFGIAVVRDNPKTLSHKPRHVRYIWLSTTTDTNAINPGDIEEIYEKLTSFSSQHENGVILIEGISHLIRGTSFSTVIHTLTLLKDVISSKKNIVILSYNPDALDKGQREKIESEFQSIEEVDKK